MSTKEQVAADLDRASRAGQPRQEEPALADLLKMMMQQQAQTNALLQRLLPAAAQAPPLLAPRLTDRQEVVRLVDERCHQTQENHRDVWRWLFRQWHRAGHGTATTRLEDIAIAEEMGEFLAFAQRELPSKPAHRDAAETRPAKVEQANVFLAEAIELAKIDPTEVARRSGLSLDTIRKALKGNVPGQRTRARIAVALGKTVAELWPQPGSAEEQAFVKRRLDQALEATRPETGGRGR